MPPSTTVISDPPETLTPYETELIGKVRQYGWQTTSVHASADGDPAFSYTTGFWLTIDQPEMVVFDFPPELAHDVFGQMLQKAREGQCFPTGQPLQNILSNEPVYLFHIAREAAVDYLRSSHWFYKRSAFPAVQLLWTDGKGRFPWHNDFDPTLAPLQPDISARGWANEIGRATK